MRSQQKKIDPGRLGLDFDGVIADTAEVFVRLACDKYKHCDFGIDDITDFEVERCLNMQPDLVKSIFTEIMLDSVGTGLRPMPGAVEVLGELSELAPITVITARPEPTPVREWLAIFFPRSTCIRIRVIAMGAHDDKIRHLHTHNLDHFIDDRAETCVRIADTGRDAFVFDHPWNRGRHSLPTVHNWQEIRNLCME
jgi:uncharacterized HAD superfamily protein